MDFLITAHSDVGIRKKTNQDSVLIQIADTSFGKAAFGVVCDGMGGLAKGELASATLIKAFAEWFENDFVKLIDDGFNEYKLNRQWEDIIIMQNQNITNYGNQYRIKLGTTVTAVLVFLGCYYVINVGDSRVYLLNQNINQITKDQTYIQREMDMGRMTYEEALRDPKKNVLLQCVGASSVVVPDFYSGEVKENDVFMLCSDGFRHVITPEEIFQYMNANALVTEENMMQNAMYLTELDKYRREEDNISVAIIKVT